MPLGLAALGNDELKRSFLPVAMFNGYVMYLQATRIAAYAEGIPEACSNV